MYCTTKKFEFESYISDFSSGHKTDCLFYHFMQYSNYIKNSLYFSVILLAQELCNFIYYHLNDTLITSAGILQLIYMNY